MAWFMVDDKLHSHRKTVRAGVQAMGLWVIAGSWCADQLEDGFVPHYIADRIDRDADMHAAELVAAGLWTVMEKDGEQGWLFHNWAQFQPTREEVEAKREAARERMARVRGNKRSGSQEVRANSEGTSQEVRSTPALPIPTNNNTAAADAAEFDEFWAAYPKKVSKATAAKAHTKALKKATAAQIMAGLLNHLPLWSSTEEKFIPHAATWLNGERWGDKVAPAAPKAEGPRDQWARSIIVGGDQ